MSSILFLSQVLPYPLDAGPKVRAYYVLRYLTQQHDVTLISFVRSEDLPEHVDHLRTFCRDVYAVPMKRSIGRTVWAAARTLTSHDPIIVRRDQDRAMLSLLRAITETKSFEYIHADQTSMVQYALSASRMAKGQPRLVLDAHNALFKVFGRLARQAGNPIYRQALVRETRRLQEYEQESYRRFDEVVFVTEEDRQEFQIPQSTTIPICGSPATIAPVIPQTISRCLFVGALHWPPNTEGARWFLEHVWPVVVRTLPDLQLTIIGKLPPQDIVQTTVPNVEVLGYVDELGPFLSETGVFVVPLWSGGGMRVKIVDAWTWGLPIVSTSVGAEGAAYEHGVNLLIADTPADFADAVVRIVQDQELADRLRAEGRRTAVEHYDWRTVYRAWDAIYPHGSGDAGQRAARPLAPSLSAA